MICPFLLSVNVVADEFTNADALAFIKNNDNNDNIGRCKNNHIRLFSSFSNISSE